MEKRVAVDVVVFNELMAYLGRCPLADVRKIVEGLEKSLLIDMSIKEKKEDEEGNGTV